MLHEVIAEDILHAKYHGCSELLLCMLYVMWHVYVEVACQACHLLCFRQTSDQVDFLGCVSTRVHGAVGDEWHMTLLGRAQVGFLIFLVMALHISCWAVRT